MKEEKIKKVIEKEIKDDKKDNEDIEAFLKTIEREIKILKFYYRRHRISDRKYNLILKKDYDDYKERIEKSQKKERRSWKKD